MASKKIVSAMILLAAVSCSYAVEDAVQNEPQAMQLWRAELRQAVDGAATQLQSNLILTLTGIANSGLRHTAEGTRALGILTTALVNNTIDLAGVVGYLPRLLVQDLPTQFVEVLRLIRRNEIRAPADVGTAIDNVIILVRQAEESGITERLFGPITRFLPNLLTGVNDFMITIFNNVFGFLGANLNGNQLY